jgi:exopolysaccharide biosynthesis polyprenyl glycosylphosphotransferase
MDLIKIRRDVFDSAAFNSCRIGLVEFPSLRTSLSMTMLAMIRNGIIILGAAGLASLYMLYTELSHGQFGDWSDAIIRNHSIGYLLILYCWFTFTLTFISQRLSLHSPRRLNGFMHEQRLSLQSCLIAGLLLAGALHLLDVDEIPRRFVWVMIGMVTILFSLLRLFHRALLYHWYKRGIETRNVLIMGTGPESQALRQQLKYMPHLGYSFKGFVDLQSSDSLTSTASNEVVGTLDSLIQCTRKYFIDEIFFTTPYDRNTIQTVLRQVRLHGIGLRVIPEVFDGESWSSPVEYIGQFPTIPLHCCYMPEAALLLKRSLDIVFSILLLILLSPVLLIIAIAVKLDSRGPVFFFAERIGKKGRIFHCAKFRTMVSDAEQRRTEVMHLNERDGILFKVTNDPRITRIGRILRKYSLDELPQFYNVLKGDMSVVGPRPPIASEVQQYKLSHLRRLDVPPGITGLWQVQGRQDPSFERYISLDMNYIDNWSLLLDIKIILRTFAVVFAGTGS